jgi:hypothetical protein
MCFANDFTRHLEIIKCPLVNLQKRQRVICGMGGGVDCRGDYQRHGNQQFNPDPHQRSTETYGMDKS